MSDPSVSDHPVDTDHVDLSWEGLDEAVEAVGKVSSLVSSNCLPSMSTVGGEGLKRCSVGRQACVTLNTRDWAGNCTPGPRLQDISFII